MSPAELSYTREAELKARRLGMRTLDSFEIAKHFGAAAGFRKLIRDHYARTAPGAIGTKGSGPDTK